MPELQTHMGRVFEDADHTLCVPRRIKKTEQEFRQRSVSSIKEVTVASNACFLSDIGVHVLICLAYLCPLFPLWLYLLMLIFYKYRQFDT